MPAINNLLVALPATPEHLKKFQAAAPGAHIVQALPADVTAEMVRQADVIIVVSDGKIIEQGRHSELMKKRGYYYNLYTRQFTEELMRG